MIRFKRHFTAWGGELQNPSLHPLTDYLPAGAWIISPPAAAAAPSAFWGWLSSGRRFLLWHRSPSILPSIFWSHESVPLSSTCLPQSISGSCMTECASVLNLTPEPRANGKLTFQQLKFKKKKKTKKNRQWQSLLTLPGLIYLEQIEKNTFLFSAAKKAIKYSNKPRMFKKNVHCSSSSNVTKNKRTDT